MTKYPIGVECHGGSLRLWFIYKGKRVRENLGVPDTPKNRKRAGELRSAVCYAIKTGSFNYAEQFPNSPNLIKFGGARMDVTLGEMVNKWLSLKSMELTKNALNRYTSYMNVCCQIMGSETNLRSVTNESLLAYRKELLTGFQFLGKHQKNRSAKKGRTVPTVNAYMACLGGMMKFALDNRYIDINPMGSISPLKKARACPDPLTREEFQRIMAVSPCEQITNLWELAVYTGMRHGEICALAWEDIDTEKWVIKVTRNMAVSDHFTPPKTESGVREILLTQPAIAALKKQMPFTRMSRQQVVVVNLREKDKTREDDCTFVFSPRISSRNGQGGEWYSPGSINGAWNRMLRKAGVRHRKAYESRHTYACWSLSAGANPNFIAQQMGHASSQMIYNVYGKWMSENSVDQIGLLNAQFTSYAPPMPQSNAS
jgi:integrase